MGRQNRLVSSGHFTWRGDLSDDGKGVGGALIIDLDRADELRTEYPGMLLRRITQTGLATFCKYARALSICAEDTVLSTRMRYAAAVVSSEEVIHRLGWRVGWRSGPRSEWHSRAVREFLAIWTS